MKPGTVNPLQSLLLVWAAGAVLSREGDNLHIEALKGAISPPLVEALRANKADLLTILPARTSVQSNRESTT
jgi:hypothetical protein